MMLSIGDSSTRDRVWACVVIRVLVVCEAFTARRRCDAIRVAVVLFAFGLAAAGGLANAVMHKWCGFVGLPLAPVVVAHIPAEVIPAILADRRANAGCCLFWVVRIGIFTKYFLASRTDFFLIVFVEIFRFINDLAGFYVVVSVRKAVVALANGAVGP